MTPAPQTTTCRGAVTGAGGRSKLPVLVPRRVRANALARDGDVEQVRAIVLRHALEAATERGLEIFHLRDLLTLDALRAREADVIDHRRAEREARVLAVAHHLAVRHLVGPVVAHDLVALVVGDDDEHRGAVAGHRPEADRAVAERAVTQVADHGALATDGDLGADGRAHAEAERAAAAARRWARRACPSPRTARRDRADSDGPSARGSGRSASPSARKRRRARPGTRRGRAGRARAPSSS